jgi:hypothetical protein
MVRKVVKELLSQYFAFCSEDVMFDLIEEARGNITVICWLTFKEELYSNSEAAAVQEHLEPERHRRMFSSLLREEGCLRTCFING